MRVLRFIFFGVFGKEIGSCNASISAVVVVKTAKKL